MYMCMWGYLDKYIRVATWPPQTKIPGSAPDEGNPARVDFVCYLELTRYLASF